MRSWIVGLCSVLVIGCGDDSPGSSGTDATESTTTETSTSTGNTSPSSSSASATDSASESSSSEGSSSTGGSESTSLPPETDSSDSSGESSSSTTMVVETTSSTTDPMTGSSEDTGGLASNGEQCMESDDCQSGFCYLAGILGGICGDCIDDDDCVWGCGAANPLAMPPTGSTCDDGSIGAGCQTDAACQMTLQCAEIIDVPGVITLGGCSECVIDADCDELCSPNYEDAFTELEGHWECIAADSLPLGAGCDYAGTGDQACDSGFCAIADVSGLLLLGVCSECEVDDDCGAGGTCSAPEVDLAGAFTPGACI